MITPSVVQEAAVSAYCKLVKSGVLKHTKETQVAYLIGFGNGGAFSAGEISKDITTIKESVAKTSGFLARFKRGAA